MPLPVSPQISSGAFMRTAASTSRKASTTSGLGHHVQSRAPSAGTAPWRADAATTGGRGAAPAARRPMQRATSALPSASRSCTSHAQVQAPEHAVERLVEQFLEGGAVAAHVQPVQQLAAARVGGEEAALVVEREQAGAERAQELLARVDGDQAVLAHLVGEQAVLELRGGHLHQRLRVLLARLDVGRGIEHADDLARRVAHGRGGAREVTEAGEVVFLAADRHRASRCERGAQAVGAAQRLAPATAGDDLGAGAAHDEAVVGDDVQDHALRIREREQEVGAGDLLRQRLELGLREAAHDGGALAPLREVVRLDHGDRHAGREVHAPSAGSAPSCRG